MGHFTEVYGYITCLDQYEQHNFAQIQLLPSEDTQPKFTRDMFATPHAIYDEQMIVFGQAYNGVERYWEAWLEKFESLLRAYSETVIK